MPTANPPTALKLDYAFVSTPNPIRASAEGANPNTIDLQVIVSNPTLSPVSLRQVTIEIPTGEESSRAISTSPNLPSPVYDTSGLWIISAAGGTIALKPRSGTQGSVTTPIVLSLDGIQVNKTLGTVPLTITELPPSGQKVSDGSTYSLLKQPANFPVTSFYADPATVTDLEQTVTLRWTCTEQGKQDVFGLRIAGIQATASGLHADSGVTLVADSAPTAGAASRGTATFKDCVADGNCYTWQDGVAGVVTPAVNQTTTFALDIVQTDGAGHRTVIASLTTTVQVTMPWISQSSYVESLFGGRVLWLHWLAFNARSCTLQLDGVTVDDNAPTDTYRDGYLFIPADGAGPQRLEVIAHAATGRAQASFPFPTQVISPSTKIDIPSPGSIAITPDGQTALVASSVLPTASVRVIDVGARKAEPAALYSSSEVALRVAITPDGSLALVSSLDWNVYVIDLPGRTVEPAAIPAVRDPGAAAITPDGKTALVAGFTDFVTPSIAVIDVPGRKLETTFNPGTIPYAMAITPDGALALMTSWDHSTVSVIDVAKRTVEATTIPTGRLPWAIAITPDGALALVANASDNNVSVIHVAERTVEATPIPTGALPSAIAITPDGRLALVTNASDEKLTIIDIARRKSASIGWMPSVAVAITPDGTTALLAVQQGDDVRYVGML